MADNLITPINALITSITPEIYQRLVTAVETGKWPDGVRLTALQKESSLQLVLLWQSKYNDQPQHMSIGKEGNIVTKSKQQLKQQWGLTDQ